MRYFLTVTLTANFKRDFLTVIFFYALFHRLKILREALFHRIHLHNFTTNIPVV